jgi:hypothetical protein
MEIYRCRHTRNRCPFQNNVGIRARLSCNGDLYACHGTPRTSQCLGKMRIHPNVSFQQLYSHTQMLTFQSLTVVNKIASDGSQVTATARRLADRIRANQASSKTPTGRH